MLEANVFYENYTYAERDIKIIFTQHPMHVIKRNYVGKWMDSLERAYKENKFATPKKDVDVDTKSELPTQEAPQVTQTTEVPPCPSEQKIQDGGLDENSVFYTDDDIDFDGSSS